MLFKIYPKHSSIHQILRKAIQGCPKYNYLSTYSTHHSYNITPTFTRNIHGYSGNNISRIFDDEPFLNIPAGKPYVHRNIGGIVTVKNWDNIAFMDIVNLPHGWKGLCTAITKGGYAREIIERNNSEYTKSRIEFPITKCMGYAISPVGREITNYSQHSNTNMNANDLNKSPTICPISDIEGSLKNQIGSRTRTKKQLFSGHLRIDFNQALCEGNCILFRGNSNSGKTNVSFDIAANFIAKNYTKYEEGIQSSQHKVIYVSSNMSDIQKGIERITKWGEYKEGMLDHITFITPHPHSKDDATFDAEIYLSPRTGFLLAEYYRNMGDNVLLIIDDVIAHHLKEKILFRIINLPFGPIDFYNEIMENSGCFKGKGTMTSIFVLDLNNTHMEYLHIEKQLNTNLESMTDFVLEFDNIDHAIKSTNLPKLKFVGKQNIFNYWQHPFIKQIQAELYWIINQIDQANVSHKYKKDLKIEEDPWDNYLYYDALKFIPLLENSDNLCLSKQLILICFFLDSFTNDQISNYKLTGILLQRELFKFLSVSKQIGEEETILDKTQRFVEQDILNKEISESTLEGDSGVLIGEMKRAFHMFIIHMQANKLYSHLKDDYFSPL